MRSEREVRPHVLLLAAIVLAAVVASGCTNGATLDEPEEAPALERAEIDVPSPIQVEGPANPAPSPAREGDQQATASDPAQMILPESPVPDATRAATDPPDPAAPEETSQSTPRADDGASAVEFPPGAYLFIEIVETRLTKSDAAGQTTSFVGEETTYTYDRDEGKLTGALIGMPLNDVLVIVGRIVVTQIDRTKASAGQLHALTQAGQAFGTVVLERVSPEGSVFVTVNGDGSTLGPGESMSTQLRTRGEGDRLASGVSGRSVTVTNHGFLQIENLDLAGP